MADAQGREGKFTYFNAKINAGGEMSTAVMEPLPVLPDISEVRMKRLSEPSFPFPFLFYSFWKFNKYCFPMVSDPRTGKQWEGLPHPPSI
jgi:hypothetical protein